MRQLSSALSTLALCLLAALWVSCGGPDSQAAGKPAVLKFTAIPHKDTQDLKAKFDPLARWLGAQLGIQVEYVPAADYDASVEMFKNGDVHLAWFGGYTGEQARGMVPGSVAIVAGKEDLAFKSYFIAHSSTGIEKSDEFPMALAGKSFTFGSAKSTSGRLMPEYFIRKFTQKAPDQFFAGTPGFSGSHDLTWKAVSSGSIQSGALDYSVYDAAVKKGDLDPALCRIVWVSPPYADYNMTARSDLDALFGEGMTKRVQQTLVSLTDEKLLAAFGRSALVPVSNSDFEALGKVARDLGLLK